MSATWTENNTLRSAHSVVFAKLLPWSYFVPTTQGIVAGNGGEKGREPAKWLDHERNTGGADGCTGDRQCARTLSALMTPPLHVIIPAVIDHSNIDHISSPSYGPATACHYLSLLFLPPNHGHLSRVGILAQLSVEIMSRCQCLGQTRQDGGQQGDKAP
ncbi:unnamed protein product [Cyclocybe aegerita]|uniref:Uncharacterized protein n=1 Tax=Cyclocybe aegerita TaxID=1973307 RepID=A0A8S0VVX8_CYCAE|nr:unnamed protein product [Cyclocybe aegerita]